MHRKLFLALITAVFLLSIVLTGCQGGISQELYDQVAAQIKEAQANITEIQGQAQAMQAEKEAVAAELQAARAKIAELEGQVGGLKEQYELVGATKAETAENIVRNYYETHEYSKSDLFICSDMASEVWNILKAHGIAAIIVIGNKDVAIGEILQSNHAWVLAEVAPGEYLALETTAGIVIPRSKNPRYYRGWYFDSPRELKANNQLVREYNIRVGIHNQIVAEDGAVVDEHNQATNPATQDKLFAVHQKLDELIKAQQAEMKNIQAEIDGLATRLP